MQMVGGAMIVHLLKPGKSWSTSTSKVGGIPGKSADLLPTWDIMLRVYRETIGPKGGNLDELHLYEVDLMANSFAKRGTGEKLDVMDYIYNEMWSSVMEKK